ncbi:hypothetical protein HPB47_009732 [Ixodes persulcatus]|uniref:Uncharacterized protein n=1 Tax=Ixodes persulcatus TaxID=34615 RepID=A0AC60P110_IXOPE|nr:hypothetical protein HPB47_009732 [Ixodes persulcatus]
MERRQRQVGRQALGCHGMVATEAVQGDLGWSSFEAREATSKTTYDSRLRIMDRGRWAKRLFIYTYLTGVQTVWRRRLYQLEKKYGFFATPVTITSDRKWELEIRNRADETIEHLVLSCAGLQPVQPAEWGQATRELALAEALGFGSASSSVAGSAGGTNSNNNADASPITEGGVSWWKPRSED